MLTGVAWLCALLFRLTQVKVALKDDPTNGELSSLQSELEQLIDLCRAAIQPAPAPVSSASSKNPSTSTAAASSTPAPAPLSSSTPNDASPLPSSASSTPTQNYKVGDEVLAKYTDSKFYPAKIISGPSGPSHSPLFTLLWTSYSSSPPTTLPLSSLKPLPPAQKRKLEESQKEEAEKEKKKAKNEKWKEVKKSKNEEAVQKQQSWQKFGVKAKKKGIAIAGLQGDSIFRSPDNPNGKGLSSFRCLFARSSLFFCSREGACMSVWKLIC
jgi:survival-of-motor-neuron-related-splicing factor 30